MPTPYRARLAAVLLLVAPCLVLAEHPIPEPRTLVLAPTPTPTQARKDARPMLQERQFLCGLFGNCRTTTVIEPGVAPSSSTSSAVDSATSSSSDLASSTSSTASSSSSTASSTSAESSSTASSSTVESSPASSSSTSSDPSPSSSASSSSASSLSQSVITITSIVTNSDGSSSTITSASSSAVAVPVQNNSSGGLSGQTWGIIGGIVGGVAALIVGLFVFWKIAKRRSANRAMDQIAWPELQNDATGGAFSTLNPQGTRRTGGAGFEMEKDRGDGQYYYDEEDADDHTGAVRGGGWASPGALSPRLAYDPRMSGQFYGAGGEGQYGYANEYGQAPNLHGQYYDPYRQEAPLPSLPPGAAGPSRATSPRLPMGAAPSSPRHPGALPYPGSPVHSFEMASEPTYPPRSGRPYSGATDDAYGGYAAGLSTDDVPLTATAQAPASSSGGGGGGAGLQHGYRY